MVHCWPFAVIFCMAYSRILTMGMDFYHLLDSSGAAFAAQMAKAVECAGM